MIELEEARERILAALPLASNETIPLADTAGRICSDAIVSPIRLPCFDNSAMDGYALRAEDMSGAGEESPIALTMVGRVPAGDIYSGESIQSGQCVRIFTGSPLPPGADAVIMQEDTRAKGDAIECLDPVKPWENVRLAGEDVKQGSTLAKPGDAITVGRLAVLAAVGVDAVKVGCRPKVGLLATGDELREPGQELKPGEIYESNRRTLAQLARNAGAIPVEFPVVPDRLDATIDDLKTAFEECDFVVTSGGVSVGEMDFVKEAFEKLGGTMDFWKVRMKPGKPFVFGQLGGKLLFGLPGNPVSAMVTFLMLARPAIVCFQGGRVDAQSRMTGVLVEPLANRGNRRHFFRVRMDDEGNVHSAGMQASHALGALADANGLVDVPPDSSLEVGGKVNVFRWDQELR